MDNLLAKKPETSLGPFAVIVLIVDAVANAAGYLFDLYRISWFDTVLHGYTLFALTLAIGLYGYRRILIGRESHAILLGLAITMIGVGMGGVWELIEWGYDASVSGNAIRGKFDTMVDLVADTIGAAAAAVVCLAMVPTDQR